MRLLTWSELTSQEQAHALQRGTADAGAEVRAIVADIIDDVRREGDKAVRELTARFDSAARQDADLLMSASEIEAAVGSVSSARRAAIAEAAGRIRDFHRAGMQQDYQVQTAPGVLCERVVRPIARVGLYVPAGTAPLPSTALMLGVPAQLAGCDDVVLCTPPGPDGRAEPTVVAAAVECGISQIVVVGGAQAIAAMAYGTESVPRCDKLFGPGNAFVTEAKRQVTNAEGGPGIDMPAGPSEVVVIADSSAVPEFVAADLLSQAEHGADSQALLLTDDPAMAEAVTAQVDRQVEELPRADIARKALDSSVAIVTRDIATAVAVSNEYAPEHLILALRDPREWLSHVRRAGSIFLGHWAPETLGDYCSGTNHVLPTAGAARYTGGVNVSAFQIAMTVQHVTPTGLQEVGPCAIELSEAEQLHAHQRAVTRRLAVLDEST